MSKIRSYLVFFSALGLCAIILAGCNRDAATPTTVPSQEGPTKAAAAAQAEADFTSPYCIVTSHQSEGFGAYEAVFV